MQVLAANAASAALLVSDVPWDGPVGVVRVAWHQGTLLLNPSSSQLAESDFSLIYAGTEAGCVMVLR